MAKKETGMKDAKKAFKAQAEAKAKAHQAKRLEFISKFGKALSAAWAKLGDKANVMAVAKAAAPKEPIRLVDYALVALGLRESKDKGLAAWVKADHEVGLSAATPAPKKARKATKGEHEASTTA